MKKTQVALAAMALVASTAVLADGVKLYGTVDASVAKSTGASVKMDGAGNWAGSIFGMTGSEDFDGGSVFFNLEGGVNLADGSATNNGSMAATFNRKTNIGISSGAGTVTVGLQLSPYIGAALGGIVNNNESFYVPLLSLVGDRTVSALAVSGGNGTGSTGANTSAFFVNNAVSYSTPSINGIKATVLSRISGGTTENKYRAYSVSYAAAENLTINYGYQTSEGYTNFANLALTEGAYTTSVISGTYVMGDNTIGLALFNHNDKANSSKTSTTMAGIGHKVNDQVTVGLQYAKNDADTASGITNLGAQYKLGATSYLYVTASRATGGASALYSTRANGWSTLNSSTAGETGYAVGMVKSF